MKKGNTRALNKRLQRIEDRLLGLKVRPIRVILINSYSLEDNPKQPTKARICSQHQPVSRNNSLEIRIIDNYNGEPLGKTHQQNCL